MAVVGEGIETEIDAVIEPQVLFARTELDEAEPCGSDAACAETRRPYTVTGLL